LHIPNNMSAPACAAIVQGVAVDVDAFDVSDVGGTDIASTADALTIDTPHAGARADRADRAAAVLAMCALMVFKDRRRSRRCRAFALPGL
jgi:hypothetical protein